MKACTDFIVAKLLKILSKTVTIYNLPRNVVTDQFVDFLVFSQFLCSSSSFPSRLNQRISLSWLEARPKIGSSHEIPSSSPEQLIDFPYLRRKQNRNDVLKSGNIDKSCREKMQNKLTSACNPRANRSRVLANQNALSLRLCYNSQMA